MRLIVAALSALALSGCAGLLAQKYDQHARTECEQQVEPRDLGECLDRVEQRRRDRD